MSLDNAKLVIDRKQNLGELCQNVCQQHARFIAEIERANANDIQIVFLVEHGKNIRSLNDVNKWHNPRLKVSPKALTGQRLFKILYTISNKYKVDFVFCEKEDTAKKIIEILTNECKAVV